MDFWIVLILLLAAVVASVYFAPKIRKWLKARRERAAAELKEHVGKYL